MKFSPSPFQRRAIERIVRDKHAGILARPGLGKTVCVLTAFEILRRRGEVDRLLVIAPKRVCETTWRDEPAKWDHLSFQTADAFAQDWDESTLRRWDGYLLNYERLPQFFGRPAERNGRRVWVPGAPWETVKQDRWMLVLDESTRVKNASGVWNKTLQRYWKDFARTVILTGTPQPNGAHDLFGQMLLLDGGETFGKHVTKFRAEYFDEHAIPGRRWVKRTLKDGAFEKVVERMKRHTESFMDEDYAGLPPEVVVPVPVVLPAVALAGYNTATDQVRKRQWANGIVYEWDPFAGVNKAAHVMHTAKLDAVDDLLDELGAPALIVYEHLSEAHELIRRLKAAGRKVAALATKDSGHSAISDWNAGKLNALIIHPQSGGIGLNLQSGGSALIWLGPTWNLEHWIQTNARLRRTGQTAEKVMVYVLVAKGTVDERVIEVLASKDASQQKMMEELEHG